MEDAARTNVPRGEFDFECVPETDQSFENALRKAEDGERLTVADTHSKSNSPRGTFVRAASSITCYEDWER
jgi:hypothetical protein